MCIRPHALRVVSLGDREAVRATVNAAVWRGATTRLVLSVTGLPDQLIDVDVPGNAQFDIGSEVGVRFPDPAGVLVPAATSPPRRAKSRRRDGAAGEAGIGGT